MAAPVEDDDAPDPVVESDDSEEAEETAPPDAPDDSAVMAPAQEDAPSAAVLTPEEAKQADVDAFEAWQAEIAAMTPEEIEASHARTAEQVAAAKAAELEDYLAWVASQDSTSALPHVPDGD